MVKSSFPGLVRVFYTPVHVRIWRTWWSACITTWLGLSIFLPQYPIRSCHDNGCWKDRKTKTKSPSVPTQTQTCLLDIEGPNESKLKRDLCLRSKLYKTQLCKWLNIQSLLCSVKATHWLNNRLPPIQHLNRPLNFLISKQKNITMDFQRHRLS